jgi:hypothetical protein
MEDKPCNIFSNQLVRLLLTQSGILRDDEELIQDPKIPASAGDILRSEKYWNPKVKNYEKIWKNTKQKTSIKA